MKLRSVFLSFENYQINSNTIYTQNLYPKLTVVIYCGVPPLPTYLGRYNL